MGIYFVKLFYDYFNNNDLKYRKPKDYIKIDFRKSVKSLYIRKYIFSFLYEKKKLKFIEYNKTYQKDFNINIDNYKKLSGKYILGERNGIGREYILNTDILIFEGEYIIGKKEWKRKRIL